MKTLIQIDLNKLTSAERRGLEQRANQANMTVDQFLDYAQKVQIYRNAEEILKLKEVA